MAELLNRSTAVVKRYGGTLVQFTGDGVMAVFGAPVALEDHAVRACLAAWAFRTRRSSSAAEVQDRDGIDLRLRVGLNSGQVIAGEIGSGAMGYTAIGDQVGMAQRMESVAPPGGVMLSASTARLVDGSAAFGEPSGSDQGCRRAGAATACWASATGIAPSGVRSRLWSVGGGRCPRLTACWTVRSMATARWSAWWGHRASVEPSGARGRRDGRRPGVSTCSPPSANRTPARSLSCGRPIVAHDHGGVVVDASAARRPGCEARVPLQTRRTCCCSMICWASLIRM